MNSCEIELQQQILHSNGSVHNNLKIDGKIPVGSQSIVSHILCLPPFSPLPSVLLRSFCMYVKNISSLIIIAIFMLIILPFEAP